MDHVHVGTGVFVVNQKGQFILQRRASHKDGAGFWSVPGGSLEIGESWRQCAVREVKEETGLTITDTPQLVAATTFANWLTIWSVVPYRGNDPLRMSDESTDIMWIEVFDAQSMPLWQAGWNPLMGEFGWYQLFHLLQDNRPEQLG